MSNEIFVRKDLAQNSFKEQTQLTIRQGASSSSSFTPSHASSSTEGCETPGSTFSTPEQDAPKFGRCTPTRIPGFELKGNNTKLAELLDTSKSDASRRKWDLEKVEKELERHKRETPTLKQEKVKLKKDNAKLVKQLEEYKSESAKQQASKT
ncbi:hypothetical protein EDB82DRAFT_524926 [Fusarium venenatum]|uniref:uncharacterized protein n=1 Tax=Fusarium venenatum TaxID=56646 RepID=UPI001DEFBE9D|nr:hypothetical protein EDB82DRAFT_524926 [Fusarium venenatum]